MKVVDINNTEIFSYDLSLGYLVEDKIFVTHYPAIEPIPERFHYEVVKEYPNGGKDLMKIIDVPETPGREAYDLYEDVLRYIPYPSGTFVNNDVDKQRALEDRIAELEAALELLLSGVVE